MHTRTHTHTGAAEVAISAFAEGYTEGGVGGGVGVSPPDHFAALTTANHPVQSRDDRSRSEFRAETTEAAAKQSRQKPQRIVLHTTNARGQ